VEFKLIQVITFERSAGEGWSGERKVVMMSDGENIVPTFIHQRLHPKNMP